MAESPKVVDFRKGNPQKPKSGRFCRVCSFLQEPFPRTLQNFLDFPHLGAAEMQGGPHKSPKLVDFVGNPFLFRKPFLRSVCVSCISGIWGRRNGGTPQKPKTCRFCGEPAPFPEAISKVCLLPGFPAFAAAEMGGAQQKPTYCRFCRVRSFCGSHFQGLFEFARGFWLLGWPKWGKGTPQKPKSCRSCCGSHFQGLFGFRKGNPQKPKSC